MIDTFRSDFWALARESKGYYSWASKDRWCLARAMRRRRHCPCCDSPGSQEIVDSLFNDGLGAHPLLDAVFEALARAESRLSLRFIPQRSHEERLTGNLVSELDAALFLIRPTFSELSRQRYGEELAVDFFHCDLSQGGAIEKETGGDLAIILSVDLPDLPRLVRYAAFQVKKSYGAASLPKGQFRTLVEQFGDAAAYLFYDMVLSTLHPPMVLDASELKRKCDEDTATKSFTVSADEINNGLPLSLWLLTRLARGDTGSRAHNFEAAMERFTGREQQNGRLAILSVGKPIVARIVHNEVMRVSLGSDNAAD